MVEQTGQPIRSRQFVEATDRAGQRDVGGLELFLVPLGLARTLLLHAVRHSIEQVGEQPKLGRSPMERGARAPISPSVIR